DGVSGFFTGFIDGLRVMQTATNFAAIDSAMESPSELAYASHDDGWSLIGAAYASPHPDLESDCSPDFPPGYPPGCTRCTPNSYVLGVCWDEDGIGYCCGTSGKIRKMTDGINWRDESLAGIASNAIFHRISVRKIGGIKKGYAVGDNGLVA